MRIHPKDEPYRQAKNFISQERDANTFFSPTLSRDFSSLAPSAIRKFVVKFLKQIKKKKFKNEKSTFL